MTNTISLESIDGFDPLAADDTTTATSMTSVLEEASKRIVFNILKSYTGYYDVFSELLQNSLDPVQQRQAREASEIPASDMGHTRRSFRTRSSGR